MAGLRKTLYLLIVSCLSLFSLSSLEAQENSSRIESASLSEERLSIQVSVPRGRTIEAASVVIDGRLIDLNAAPVPSELNLWLLIDQSEAVINAAPTIQTGINRFLSGFGAETRIGFILYNNEVTQYLPTSNRNEISTWLSGYSGRANTPNCLNNAFSSLATQLSHDGTAQRVLVIAGTLSRQGACSDELPDLNIPIDILIVSDSIDPTYQDLQDRFGGRLLRANIQTVSNRLDEIKSSWSNPIYELLGTYTGAVDSGQLNLALSDGTELTLALSFERRILAETPETSSNNLSVLGDLVTQVPTVATTPQTSSLTNVNNNAENTNTANEDVAAPTEASLTTNATANPNEEQALTNSPSQETNASPLEASIASIISQPIALVAGALIIIMGLGLSFFVMQKSKSPKKAKPELANPRQNQQTFNFETANQRDFHSETVIEATQIDFAPDSDALDITEMFEAQAPAPVDIFEVTQIVTEEELRSATKSKPVALLRNELTQELYEIYSPDTNLGRLDTCNISIKGDAAISREHLRFIVNDNDEIEVVVLSQNPVLLNQLSMAKRGVICFGDVLQITPQTQLRLIQPNES